MYTTALLCSFKLFGIFDSPVSCNDLLSSGGSQAALFCHCLSGALAGYWFMDTELLYGGALIRLKAQSLAPHDFEESLKIYCAQARLPFRRLLPSADPR